MTRSVGNRFLRRIVGPVCPVLCCFVLLGSLAAANKPLPAKSNAAKIAVPPNIVLITLDTTRADRMGFLGSTRDLTPNLDELAKQSAVFERAYAQLPITTGSHATILTGTYPQFHGINSFGPPLAKDLPYAPAILRTHGYHTAAFVGSIVLNAQPGYAPGFDRGFDTYDAGFTDVELGQDRYKTAQRRGEEVVAHAVSWLNENSKAPFFIWIHLYDAHDPYDPPEPYKTKYASEPYDGGIAYEDAAVGKLFQELKARGLFDNSVIAVTADHGESLGAHGEDTHGFLLYDETIRVPLLIKLPRAASSGAEGENAAANESKHVAEPVELVDVLPTLLQTARISIPHQVQGRSLLALIEGEATKPEPEDTLQSRGAYSEDEYGQVEFGWSPVRALRKGKYLYIQAPKPELYDLTADPAAEHNIAASSAAVAHTLAGEISALRQKTSRKHEGANPQLDAKAQESLSSLGYTVGVRAGKPVAPDEGPDPKDKIEIANMARRAEILHWDRHIDEAIALLQQVMEKDPSLSFYPRIASWYLAQNQPQKAVAALRNAVKMDPDSVEARFKLGQALMLTEDFESAIPQLEAAVKQAPKLIEAHSYLELAYARTNRFPQAIAECKTVLKDKPGDYGSYLILGRSLGQIGDAQGAIAALTTAGTVQPLDPTSHEWLAELYQALGQTANAERERAEVDRLRTLH